MCSDSNRIHCSLETERPSTSAPGAARKGLVFLSLALRVLGRAGSPLRRRLFSSSRERGPPSRGLAFSLGRPCLSCGAERAPGHWLSSWGSQALERRPESCSACASLLRSVWLFLAQGSNPCLLHRQVDSLLLDGPGSPGTEL